MVVRVDGFTISRAGEPVKAVMSMWLSSKYTIHPQGQLPRHSKETWTALWTESKVRHTILDTQLETCPVLC
jgi:hypothetical protein